MLVGRSTVIVSGATLSSAARRQRRDGGRPWRGAGRAVARPRVTL